jgi:hypothetical protein
VIRRAVLTAALLAAPAVAQWGGGLCAPVGAPRPLFLPAARAQMAPAAPAWRWVATDDPDQHALYRGGAQHGVYRLSTATYHLRTGPGRFVAAAPPDGAPPAPKGCGCGCRCGTLCGCKDTGRACSEGCRCATPPAVGQLPDWMTRGVDSGKLGGREKVTVNGREVTQDEALRLVGGKQGALPDDAHKPFLLDVGPEDAGKKLDADLKTSPELSVYHDTFRRQSYRPDAPMTRDRDGKVAYTPGVYAVTCGGRAVRLADSYQDAGQLAGALRKLPADFDPGKIPNVGPAPLPLPAVPGLPDWLRSPWVLAGIAVVVIYLLTRQRS